MKKFTSGIVYAIVLLFFCAVVSVIALLGGSFMRIFGFDYDSVFSIVLFFVFTAVSGFPLECFAKAIPQALFSLNKIPQKTAQWLFVCLDTLSTMAAMTVIDFLMPSVSASPLAVFAVSFAMAVFCKNDI